MANVLSSEGSNPGAVFANNLPEPIEHILLNFSQFGFSRHGQNQTHIVHVTAHVFQPQLTNNIGSNRFLQLSIKIQQHDVREEPCTDQPLRQSDTGKVKYLSLRLVGLHNVEVLSRPAPIKQALCEF